MSGVKKTLVIISVIVIIVQPACLLLSEGSGRVRLVVHPGFPATKLSFFLFFPSLLIFPEILLHFRGEEKRRCRSRGNLFNEGVDDGASELLRTELQRRLDSSRREGDRCGHR